MNINPQRPFILKEGINTEAELAELRKNIKIWRERDIYELQLKELFKITHPQLKDSGDLAARREKFIKENRMKKSSPDILVGDWIYYPWSGILMHSVNEKELFLLRTNRNRNLVTEEEQKLLASATIGIIGLSIGSHMAMTLAHLGVCGKLKLAEYDALDTTNLNRIQARIDQVGEPKIHITAQKIYEMNPYADIDLFEEGLNEESLDEFLFAGSAPLVILEAMDNFEMKIKLRIEARKKGIAVISPVNLGDSILIDVERFDLDRNLPIFNGRAGKVPEEILKSPDLTDPMKHKYAIDLVGIENIPERAINSVKEIGRTLTGRPQLMSTVTISGGIAAYIVRQIILGLPIESGRKLVHFNDFIN